MKTEFRVSGKKTKAGILELVTCWLSNNLDSEFILKLGFFFCALWFLHTMLRSCFEKAKMYVQYVLCGGEEKIGERELKRRFANDMRLTGELELTQCKYSTTSRNFPVKEQLKPDAHEKNCLPISRT